MCTPTCVRTQRTPFASFSVAVCVFLPPLSPTIRLPPPLLARGGQRLATGERQSTVRQHQLERSQIDDWRLIECCQCGEYDIAKRTERHNQRQTATLLSLGLYHSAFFWVSFRHYFGLGICCQSTRPSNYHLVPSCFSLQAPVSSIVITEK